MIRELLLEFKEACRRHNCDFGEMFFDDSDDCPDSYPFFDENGDWGFGVSYYEDKTEYVGFVRDMDDFHHVPDEDENEEFSSMDELVLAMKKHREYLEG